jgi:hypothetical protein
MITTERAIDAAPSDTDRAARLRIVATNGELVETREALRIRPLIEHPALRRAMGLDTAAPTTDGGLPKRRAGSYHGVAPVRSSGPATAPAATPVRPRAAAPVRRFDRRALLESAN